MVLSGDLEEALSVYSELNGFGDSEIRISKINAVLNAREHFAEKNTNEGINDIFDQDGTIQVTYVCNGGSIIKSQNNDTITRQLLKGYALAVPTKVGYSFEKWELREYCVGFDLQNITAELRLEAVWSECAYSISYDLDGGTVATTNPTSYKYESEDVVIQNPTKTGYTFIGWSGEDIEEPTTELIIRQGSQGDKSFIANWQANTYTITFNVNGGTIDETQVQVKYDMYVSLPTPNKSGSTFSGWYCEGKKIENGEWGIAKDCTLDAQWDLITYTVSYDLNGGTNASGNPSSYSAYDEFSLQEPTKTGYTFLGWRGNNVSETTKKVTIPKGSIGNRSYTAVWQANSYTINYDADGGTINETVQNVMFDESVTLYSAKKTGYTFAGWYYGDTKLSSGIWKITNNVSVKAKWVANSNTKYMVYHYLENANDSEYTLTKTQTLYGTTATSVSPSVESYAYFTIPAKQTITISCDGTSFVKYYYKREKFTLTLYPNNGAAIQTKTFKYGQSISGADNWVSRTGYTFAGWYTDLNLSAIFTDKSMPGSSVNLYAYWSEESKTSLFGFAISFSSVTITQYNGNETSIVVPRYIGNLPVTTINYMATNNMQNVSLPQSVITIGDNAFKDATTLQRINLESIVSIGSNAFSGCTALIDPSFNSLTTLGDYAFSGCTSIIDISLPNTVSGNLNYCFYNCSKLERIIVSRNITGICANSFYGCSSLKEITLPFTGISADVWVKKPNTNALAVANDMFGIIFSKTDWGACTSYLQQAGTFFIPSNLTKVTLYGDVKPYAFDGIKQLKEVILLESKEISSNAFSSCESLTSVQMDTVETIGKNAFSYCTSLLTITLTTSVSNIYAQAFSWGGNALDIYYDGTSDDWSKVNKIGGKLTNSWNYNRDITVHFNDGSSSYQY